MWFWPHFIGSQQQLHSFIPKNPQNNGRDLVTVVVSEKKKNKKKTVSKIPEESELKCLKCLI